jgi:excisionase family DNA binding protein
LAVDYASRVADQISVTEAAAELKVSRARVLVLIGEGRLPAAKVGNQYVIQRKDLAKVRVRKVGRPPNR